ncbi:hypothetical protein SHIRM173S_11512 [Streptomyces hirsutus]
MAEPRVHGIAALLAGIEPAGTTAAAGTTTSSHPRRRDRERPDDHPCARTRRLAERSCSPSDMIADFCYGQASTAGCGSRPPSDWCCAAARTTPRRRSPAHEQVMSGARRDSPAARRRPAQGTAC